MSASVSPSTYCDNRALQQRRRIEVGLAAELLNALGNLVGVLALGVGVLLEFVAHRHAVNAGRHEVVVHVAQHADNLRGQRLVQNRNSLLYVAFVGVGDGAFIDLLLGTSANLFYIVDKLRHNFLSSLEELPSGRPNERWTSSGGTRRCTVLEAPERWCRCLIPVFGFIAE